jgi:hypothetical protein
MSMDKAIEHGKEKRKKRRGMCMGAKGCPICHGNHEYKIKKAKLKANPNIERE